MGIFIIGMCKLWLILAFTNMVKNLKLFYFSSNISAIWTFWKSNHNNTVEKCLILQKSLVLPETSAQIKQI